MFPHLANNPIFYNEILNVGKKKKIGNTTVDLALKLSDFTNGMFTTFPTAVAPMGPDHLLFYYL